ncbi:MULTISPECIES: GNAT family N-acetyltransferase [Hydrogenophaga]|uniref:N-acetyltransferase GCN5 n=1 Tax=Hydrogenophaga intermedia TaxID=65786 RepID=A0A1L1PHI6_HYDIT|nr:MULTISPECIES: GNAT family N-acetyltransferase [Hydrogenophaga]AOS79176.1 GNAT family N-acetyltransferase [Hydrogenophaga sp. PBC]CDN87453.1 N-acetyltransferase GCN5 [Hydrogenophaga intermedia]
MIAWRCARFDELSAREVYELMRLRSEVFVVEQRCVYLDADGADPGCWHLMGEDGDELQAYARLVPAGLKFAEASIGRVVCDPSTRGTGLGHALMREAVERVRALWGPGPIRIGAQAHLEGFYRQHGFLPDGAPYDEDGIPHIEMLRP